MNLQDRNKLITIILKIDRLGSPATARNFLQIIGLPKETVAGWKLPPDSPVSLAEALVVKLQIWGTLPEPPYKLALEVFIEQILLEITDQSDTFFLRELKELLEATQLETPSGIGTIKDSNPKTKLNTYRTPLQSVSKSFLEAGRWLEEYNRQLSVNEDPAKQDELIAKVEFYTNRCLELAGREAQLKRNADNSDKELYLTSASEKTESKNFLHLHHIEIVELLKRGQLIFVIGPNVNVCDRPPGVIWEEGQHFLPTTHELADFLANHFEYPDNDIADLARVSQYAAIMYSAGRLYDQLRPVFNTTCPPTTLHRFLANLPRLLRQKISKEKRRYPIILTANYDNLLETAFDQAGELYDLLSYTAEKDQRSLFMHYPPGDNIGRPITDPNRDRELNPTLRPIILKIHGMLDRFDLAQDNLIITEDDFIRYMSRSDLSRLIPANLLSDLQRLSLLFLGYELPQRNLRVMLHRLWEQRRNSYESWAVEADPNNQLIQNFWRKWDVKIIPANLQEYIIALEAALETLPSNFAE